MKLLDKLRGMKDKASQTAGEHSDQVKGGIDKAGDFVNERTGGKHADKIERGTEKAKNATDSLGDNSKGESKHKGEGTGGSGSTSTG